MGRETLNPIHCIIGAIVILSLVLFAMLLVVKYVIGYPFPNYFFFVPFCIMALALVVSFAIANRIN